MPILHIDFESRSAADLKKVGAVRYAMDPTTEILCMAYRVDDGPVMLWKRGDPPPYFGLLDLIAEGATVTAHNALFELSIWTYICEPRMGWGKLSPHQMDCTMARAHIMSLPGGLDRVAQLLQVKNQKDAGGYAVMMKLCRPRKLTKAEIKAGADPNVLHWNEDPADLARLYSYCIDDVKAECDIEKVLPRMSPSEKEVYHFDLTVNLRGFRLDTALMRRASVFLAEAKQRVNEEVDRITEGTVDKATKVAKLKGWLADRGLVVDGLARGDIEGLVEQARALGDEDVVEVLSLRQQGAKATSLSKYDTGLKCVGFDERARGLLQYHKASTGRWAGSLYQPHNLERVSEDDDPLIARMLTILRSGASGADMIDWCEMGPVTPMRAIGKCTRAMICAGDGHDLIGCDCSNVEGRGSAWLASEHWKLEAFRAYDEGTGPDLYKVAYSGSFGVPVDQVTKPLRQIGKVQELALGYQGGVGAFMSMGANLGIKPQALFDTVAPIADPARWSAAADKYQGSTKFGLPEEQWTALRYVVDGWRAAHPKIVQCWWDIQDAVIQAVWEPGEMVFLFGGKIRVYCTRDRRFLYIYLPSGRPLAYFKPRLDKTESNGRERWRVIVEGNDSRTNTWGDVYLYGGLLWENCVQALCRDLLVHGMMICERNGYPVVLHVHDEGVYEVPEGEGDVAEVQRMMAILPKWAAGFPLASAAWRDKRYVK